MLSLARSIGALPRVAHAMEVLGRIAASRNDHGAALRWLGEALVAGRSVGDRRVEAMMLARQGISHLESGDAAAALRHLQQAQELREALGDPAAAGDAVALAALCELRLGRPEHALSAVSWLLERLQGDLAERRWFETIDMRWSCQQVLDALGDARAAPLLVQLHADVQARAAELTDAADQDRLIQALPVFRGIVAAYQQRGEVNAAE